jgi:hypothetical protein
MQLTAQQYERTDLKTRLDAIMNEYLKRYYLE